MPNLVEAPGMAVRNPMGTVYPYPEVTELCNGIAKAHQE